MNLKKEFRERMTGQLGPEAEAFFRALDEPAPTSIRLNHKKGKAPYALTEKVKWCEEGYYLEERPRFHLDPHWHGGAYYVQEASSMILDEVMRQLKLPDQSNIWLDMCAAPGGKTGILAKHLGKRNVLIANEVIAQRRNILFENLVKGGYRNTFISGASSSAFPDAFADVILIDAPCAGEGMMRKEPEAVEQWSEKLVQSCAAMQKTILRDAPRILKPGGYLLYSTCSYSDDENMGNAEWLMNQSTLENISFAFPDDWRIRTLELGNIKGYQLYPHLVKGEGLFIAAFQKPYHPEIRMNRDKKERSWFRSPDSMFQDYLMSPDEWLIEKQHEQYYLCTREAEAAANEVRNRFPAAAWISELGAIKGKDFVPGHFFAMSNIQSQIFPVLELTLDLALDFLERKTVVVSDTLSPGWNMMRYNGTTLGWMKSTTQGLKNHYPMNWRLRQRG